jgi:UDP:flavonoid glycosyltransferase YjiC (YdhE family)
VHRRGVVFFCPPDWSHFQRISSIIAGVTALGVPVHVFTHARFRAEIEGAGAHFVDLFAERPAESQDAESWPAHMRLVAFAAAHVDDVLRSVERLKPGVIVHDPFVVIGAVVARLLGLPDVAICPGHNFAPEWTVPMIRDHPRLRVSAACQRAVEVLRERYGIADASPYMYLARFSSHLNVYCEPPEFLGATERHPFEPIAFYGSLRPVDLARAPATVSYFGDEPVSLKVFVAFGTVVWTARHREAMEALGAIASALGDRPGTRTVIALGGAENPEPIVAALERPGVTVEPMVDQWEILRQADVFVTHHGVKSTHEAVFHRVPMISYPFFGDQPRLAAVCQRLGLTVPLVTTTMGPVAPADVHAALAEVEAQSAAMNRALAGAREWELAVVDARPAVFERIAALARSDAFTPP